MPKFRLTYFDTTGRAETTRMIFGVAGIALEDRRINQEQWKVLKSKTPWGTLPILEVDGQIMGQSKAIHRFAATYVGLTGKNNIEAAMADSIVDAVTDLMDALVPVYFSQGDKKKSALQEYTGKTLAPTMQALEKLLITNRGGNGFFVGDNLTWADLNFYTTLEAIQELCPDAFKSCPKLKSLFARIQSHHRVKAYLSKRETARQKTDRSDRSDSSSKKSNMPNYRLTYFDLPGRGETTRILFALGGVKFEDNRIDFDKWGKMKSCTPWGTLPILEVDGKVIGQSKAVHRYAATQCGYAGKTLVDQAIADSAVDAICDMFDGFGPVFFAPDDQKMKMAKEYETRTLIPALCSLERLLKSNNGGNGYFVGDDITWADIHFMVCMDMITSMLSTALDSAPRLKSLYNRVKRYPKLKTYMSHNSEKYSTRK